MTEKRKNAPPFTDAEHTAMLQTMKENMLVERTGNGWKPTMWPKLKTAVDNVRAEGGAERSVSQIQNRVQSLKSTLEAYLFVEGFSGTGWDSNLKHATASEDFQNTFFQSYKRELYWRCFNKPCPYYAELYEIYEGGKNKANGKGVVRVGKRKKDDDKENAQPEKKRRGGRTRADSEDDQPDGPSGEGAATEVIDVDDDEEDTSGRAGAGNVGLENGLRKPLEGGGGGQQDKGKAKEVDDARRQLDAELVPSSPPAAKRTPPASTDKPQSKPNSGSGKRKSDATVRVAESVDSLTSALKEPVRIQDDTSHVDKVIEILENNPQLLPTDHDGALYDIVTAFYSDHVGQATTFIRTTDATRRKASIKRILDGAIKDGRILWYEYPGENFMGQ